MRNEPDDVIQQAYQIVGTESTADEAHAHIMLWLDRGCGLNRWQRECMAAMMGIWSVKREMADCETHS